MIRAIIFDVYGTLLEITPPPEDASRRWTELSRDFLPGSAPLSLAEFRAHCAAGVAAEHDRLRALGIPFPEVSWPHIARAAWPELAALDPMRLDRFLLQAAALLHTTRLMPGAAAVLARLSRTQLLLGLASNGQAYSAGELDAALESAGLNRAIFCPPLTFWSYQAGFSKPDPHVFQLLTARLLERNVSAAETLMVGDRYDNDMFPAQTLGWATWHLAACSSGRTHTGDWEALAQFLAAGNR
jgi:FMN phosphatase YigB (HAD superfamily)